MTPNRRDTISLLAGAGPAAAWSSFYRRHGEPGQAQQVKSTGPDSMQKIETRIGTLDFTHDFANGYPTDATVEKLYDERDFQRGLPGLSLVASGGRVHVMAARHHEATRRQEWTGRCDPVLRGAARHPDRQCDDALLSRVCRPLRRPADRRRCRRVACRAGSTTPGNERHSGN